ncbi:RING finger protein 37 [Betta splendens]|uniref:RING finger protein 37 n=1 Tax=Betta splendens TaxID=158456 RepID=A0A6P7NDA3_BETSP|nr:RING finger protein 37 [Betta splendens]XP_029017622.1 RING finger protein 37 [Betta splendens]XP_029017623.1 RING finger protein 37 [Betta splendens]
MVVNLCLPHFSTTIHCNKLCADGYDVTNLLSADPALRRQGFKLEYFLRPPVEVTLKFGFQVELCRVDVELWPWGMDKGQACKKLEISTSSDRLPSQSFDKEVKPQQGKLGQVKDQNEQQPDNKSWQSNGHRWSVQAQQWGEKAPDKPQGVSKCRSHTESCHLQPEFKLVGRCELREETVVCFTRSNFSPRPPFLCPPPPQLASCRQEALWNRGLSSLGAVTQLRVTVPFGGAASALGLKALAVWGQPAGCCPAEEVERIRTVHEASNRRLQPVLFTSPLSQTKQPQRTATPASSSVPEEFLDPLTQEVMALPMLLPCGVSVDNTTLEEYQKREATWGRPPNDPFTGVPFTSSSHALPNPQLKMRIDHFVLQKSVVRRDGTLGRQQNRDNPQASRLLESKTGQTQNSTESDKINTETTTRLQGGPSGHTSHNGNKTSDSLPAQTDKELEGHRHRRQNLSRVSNQSMEEAPDQKQLLPQAKRPRNDADSSCSSHEQRLSASLDEALLSALQGRPSFTSTLSQHRETSADSEPLDRMQLHKSSSEQTCSACSRSVSVYSASASCVYRLACRHLLCHACLRRETQPRPSAAAPRTNRVVCPACRSATPRTDVVRVHY